MAYLLDSTTIRAPYEIVESNSTQFAVQRTLSGDINRDYFGDNKRVWVLAFRNAKKTDYDTINVIYQSYLNTGNTKNFQVTETNYTVSLVACHVDLVTRSFSVRGTTYLSDFDLILTEA